MTLKYPKQTVQRSNVKFQLTHSIPVEVKRFSPGVYVKGVWQDGVAEVIPIFANVQPLKGHELVTMPESDRTKDWIKLYTVTPLYPVKEGEESHSGDVVMWEGNEYQVVKVFPYKMGVLDHIKVLACRLPISALATPEVL